ncbi:hypothetical protein PTSG_05025 [Salpingoeca rosetta]|uniref:MMS19 nucleotide excision repair protein n=1 Tax=Salpingoeca rosetta (strain ATCC 50818 / BSB-021) TaxID=946362 RepID=F2U9A6_SALR5|nr:uncharacterized protein PTSG_05025 [Salpingoeca rosetta]EGD73309.1 hypothetical protein PTSG_05025 [Salpingoeca rosetta]|eukprot:XP_004994340.1 hypothetical protein PTSG_05025 [Salpingoeca rosetta]
MDDVLQRLSEGKVPLTDAVSELGPLLTSTNGPLRTKGTQALVDLMVQTEKEELTSAVPVLLQFLCDRLDDHPSTTPCLRGLLALVKASAISKEQAATMCKALFQKLFVQAQALTIRLLVFQLISELLDKFGAYLSRTMGEEFVGGFLQQFDGEKDPRCLVLVFRLVPFVASTFPISRYVDDLFEASSCYFPITFTPPPNDPYGVTREELISGLRACMTATPLFARACVELVLDKASSTIDDTKVDAFETLAECATAFGFEHMSPFFSSIFAQIRREIFENLEPQVQRAALAALSACARLTSTREQADAFMQPAIEEAVHHLQDIDANTTSIHGKLLIAAAGANTATAAVVFDAFVPRAVHTFIESATDAAKRTAVGGVLAGVCEAAAACHSAHPSPSTPPSTSSSSAMDTREDGVVQLATHVQAAKPQLLSFVDAALSSSSDHLQAVGVRTLLSLSAFGIFAEDELISLLDRVLTLSLRTANSLTRAALAESCSSIPSSNQRAISHVLTSTITALSSASEPAEFKEHLKVVEAVALTGPPPVAAITSLLQRLHTTSDAEAFRQQRIAHDTANTIKIIFSNCSTEATSELVGAVLSVTSEMIKTTLDQESSCGPCRLDAATMSTLATGVCRACANLSPAQQRSLVDECSRLFTSGSPSLLRRCCEDERLTPLTWIVPAICGALPTEVTLPLSHPLVCECAIGARVVTSTWEAAVPVCSLLAAVLNKTDSNKDDDTAARVQQVVDETVAPIQRCLSGEAEACSIGAQCLFAYVTKALVMKAAAQAGDLVSLLFQMMDHPALAQGACSAVRVILQEDDVVLNRSAHAVQRLMYRQRFFQENIDRLVQPFEASPNPVYLKALSFLLKGVPLPVVKTELPVVLPLLLKSLDLRDADLLTGTLDMFKALVSDAPAQLAADVSTLVTRCLALLTHQKLVVRRSALELLAALVQLPTHVVVPFKPEVLRALRTALDDRKRVVRIAAVHASTAWHML